MTTKLITLKEYRAHLPTIWKDAQMNDITYIVTVHAKPVFEVRPILETKALKTQDYEFVTREDIQEYKKAIREYKKGETVSSKDFFNDVELGKKVEKLGVLLKKLDSKGKLSTSVEEQLSDV